jgi:hypothetical protein
MEADQPMSGEQDLLKGSEFATTIGKCPNLNILDPYFPISFEAFEVAPGIIQSYLF